MNYLDLTKDEDFEKGRKALQLVKPALEYTDGLWDLEDIGEAVLEGRMQMWVLNDSVAITQLERYPKKLLAHVFLGAGEMDDMHEILRNVEEWAANVGASKVYISGRKGWVRNLNPFGYMPTSTTVSKGINHGR